MGAAAFAVMMLLGGQESIPAPAPQSDATSPVSVEAVREGLRRPAVITLPPLEENVPVFRGTSEVPIPLDTPLQAMRRELAADSGWLGGSGFDVWAMIMGLVNKVKAAHRAWEEKEIRREVEQELAAFCAQHDCSVLESGPPSLEGILLPKFNRPQP